MDFDERCRPGTAAQLKILPSSVNFPEYYLEIEMGATLAILYYLNPRGIIFKRSIENTRLLGISSKFTNKASVLMCLLLLHKVYAFV